MRTFSVVICAALAACGGGVSEDSLTDPGAAEPEALSSSDCAGVMPASVPTGFTQERQVSDVATCLVGTSDGDGNIALGLGYGPSLYLDYEQDSWSQYTSAGAFTRAAPLYTANREFLYGGPSGFQLVWAHACNLGAPCDNKIVLTTWAAGSGATTDTPAFSTAQAPDPKGGVVIGGVDGTKAFLVQRFTATGAARSSPATVTTGPVSIFGFGASTSGPTLAVWDVAGAGGAAGTVRGRWLSPDGHSLTGTFVVATGARDAEGFDVVPLLDGSVAVRTAASGALLGFPPVYLGRFVPNSTTRTAVPSWLATRPTAQVFPIRGARAYALLFPIDASTSPCGVEHVALFSLSGTRCGGLDLDLGGSFTCVSRSGVGRDGSVFLLGSGDPQIGGASCKQRVIPALLR